MMEGEDVKKKEKNWPVTLYLEGGDQFRGWFNSSLITSIILTNQPPYQQVLSHGFVVDEKGHKMSKSLGNVIDPEKLLEKYGADVLRLWVVVSDFTKEMKVSFSILENIQESYQKIRNTLRFLLGNLANLSPELTEEKHLEKELNLIDCHVLYKLEKLMVENQKNYKEYTFNPIYSSLLNFCINDLSSFYFEISKDSLYCDNYYSQRRKQIITTLYYLLEGLLKIISPILPHLAEEVYQNIPFHFGFAGAESIYLANHSSKLTPSSLSENEKKIGLISDFFLPLRQNAYQALEKSRQEKIIDTNLQAHLIIYLEKENKLIHSGLDLKELLLVSEIEIKEEEFTPQEFTTENIYFQKTDFGLIVVKKTSKEKCLRCWNYRDLDESTCLRCKNVLNTQN